MDMHPKRSRPPCLSFSDQVAEATGLAGVLATGAVRRCCKRAGIDMQRMKRRDLKRLLPELQAVLRVYLSGSDADDAFGRLGRLTQPYESASSALGVTLDR